MALDLSKCIKVRGGVRSVFTRIYDGLKGLDKGSEEFEKGFVQLSDLNDRLAELNDEVMQLLDEESDIESDIESSILYSTKFRMLQKAIDKDKDKLGSKSTSKKLPVRLPEIKIPQFDGNSLEFNSFIELYLKMIGEREDISEIEKFSY